MTKKDELQEALLKVNDQLDGQPDDDLYVDFCTAVSCVTTIENGLIEVIKAGQQVRELQNQYFAARRQNLTATANDLLKKSKEAEKGFDKLLSYWSDQMGQTPRNQLALFS